MKQQINSQCRFPLIPLPIIEAIFTIIIQASISVITFPLIPLPIIEAILLLKQIRQNEGLLKFPLIPLPIIEAIPKGSPKGRLQRC